MKALRITQPGGPDVLKVEDVPTPAIGSNDVLVRVRAAGLNRADTLQRRGHYPPPPGYPEDIPGMEYAGEIEAIGAEVRNLHVRQRVFGLTGGGAQAEFTAIPERLAIPTPPELSDIEAGGIPEVYITAHDALFTNASLAPGETVLVHAIGSGVGLAALQIAKAFNCRVIGTSRSAEKLVRAKELGLDETIDPSAHPFDEVVLQLTDGRGVDVVIDFVGAEYLERNLNALALKGRCVFVSTLSGQNAPISMGVVMRKRLRLVGTMLRGRTVDEKVAATSAFVNQVLPLLTDGTIKVPIDCVFPLADAPAAHRYMEENKNFGKIVFDL